VKHHGTSIAPGTCLGSYEVIGEIRCGSPSGSRGTAAARPQHDGRPGHSASGKKTVGGLEKTMLRRPLILVGVLVVAITFAIVLDGAWRQRAHTQNMARAELFKREFDAHVMSGTSLSVVDEYLRGKTVKVTRSMGFRDGRDFVKELMIEVANERSIHWSCGRDSVGVIAEFSGERLTGTQVSSWSFDCL
jgi:hypothetical protein